MKEAKKIKPDHLKALHRGRRECVGVVLPLSGDTGMWGSLLYAVMQNWNLHLLLWFGCGCGLMFCRSSCVFEAEVVPGGHGLVR